MKVQISEHSFLNFAKLVIINAGIIYHGREDLLTLNKLHINCFLYRDLFKWIPR